MKKSYAFLFITLAFLFTSCKSHAQQNKQPYIKAGTIEIIQFHSEHRCPTCLLIEKLTRSTLSKNFPSIPFSLVNVDDKTNAKKAEQFQATGTALFLYNPKTGKKKDLTEFAFMKAGNEVLFEAELKKFIEEFIKG